METKAKRIIGYKPLAVLFSIDLTFFDWTSSPIAKRTDIFLV
jgi:hypothetical protein